MSTLILDKRGFVVCNLAIAVTVITFEKFIIGDHVYGFLKESKDSFLSYFLFDYGKAVLRTFSLSIVIFFVLIQDSWMRYRKAYLNGYDHSLYFFLLAQVILFVLFFTCSEIALASGGQYSFYKQFIWMVLGVSLMVMTFLSVASFHFWKTLIREQIGKIAIAVSIGAGTWWFGSVTQKLWAQLSDITFYFVSRLIGILNSSLYIEGGDRVIGLNGFFVSIDAQCSGYEGIGLVLAFVAVFTYSFRNDLKFPRALLLLPLGAFAIWSFNIARISLLILIGGYWSEEVAVFGFHSQAGWLGFILTSAGLIYLAHGSEFFSTTGKAKIRATKNAINLPIACLLPLTALLVMTLLTKAFTGQFDWLYPLRTVVVAVVIACCIKYLDLLPLKLGYHSIAAGTLVTAIWLFLVEADQELDSVFSSEFRDAGALLSLFWLIFRFVGAVITVPIAEELAFRAYLLCRISSQTVKTLGAIHFSVISFVLSSFAFGLLHGAWLAGTLAGVVFALVRYRSIHIGDAIIAHAWTNFLLFLYVVQTGHWSLL